MHDKFVKSAKSILKSILWKAVAVGAAILAIVVIVVLSGDEEETFPAAYNIIATAQDEMIRIDVTGAEYDHHDIMLEYTIYLTDISGREVDRHILSNSTEQERIAASQKLYTDKGYEKYFFIDKADVSVLDYLLSPESELRHNGELLETNSSYVLSGDAPVYRAIICQERYYAPDFAPNPDDSLTLSIGGVEVNIPLTALRASRPQSGTMSDGAVYNYQGIELLCVPTWTEEFLYIDLYELCSGDFDRLINYSGGKLGEIYAVINGQKIEGSPINSDSPYFQTNSFSSRRKFYLGDIEGEIASASVHFDTLIGVKESDSISFIFASDGSVSDMQSNLSRTSLVIDRVLCEPGNDHAYLYFTDEPKDENCVLYGFNSGYLNGKDVSHNDILRQSNQIYIVSSARICEENNVLLSKAVYKLNGSYDFELGCGRDMLSQPERQNDGDRIKSFCDLALEQAWQEIPHLQYLNEFTKGFYFYTYQGHGYHELWFNEVSKEQAAEYSRQLPGFCEENLGEYQYTATGRQDENGFAWHIECDGNDMCICIYYEI